MLEGLQEDGIQGGRQLLGDAQFPAGTHGLGGGTGAQPKKEGSELSGSEMHLLVCGH